MSSTSATVPPLAADILSNYKPKKRKSPLANAIIVAVLLAAAAFYIMPVYVMVMNGLKTKQNVSIQHMWTLPTDFSGGGFGEAFDRLRPNLWNSVRMVIPATVISSLIGAANGYLFSKWKFRGSDVIFTLVLF